MIDLLLIIRIRDIYTFFNTRQLVSQQLQLKNVNMCVIQLYKQINKQSMIDKF